MTTRIGTYGANQQYLQGIMNLQTQVNKEELQVSSGKVSQTYSGIAASADTVLNFQVSETLAQQYQTDNSITDTKLSAATAAVTGVQTTITNFKDELTTFQQNGATDAQSVNQIQSFAFQALQQMQSYLGSNINGDYLFSGGKTTTPPVQLAASSLTQFQSIYNGSTFTYPTTGSANLLNANITPKQTTALSFEPANGVIVAANAAALSPVTAGSNITVSGSTSNNNTFTVRSQAATNVAGVPLAETTATSGAGTPTITFGSTPNTISNTATGALSFAFNPSGQMTITPATANSMAALTAGTTFTISGSTNNAWDGSYKVDSNVNGVITLENNEATATSEDIGSSDLAVTDSTTNSNISLTAGTLRFSTSASPTTGLTTVTLTSAGANDFSNITAGDYVQLGGSLNHNGTFKVASVTGNSISFTANPEAVRVSQFLPQTGRNDVTLTGNNSQGSATSFTTKDYGSLSFSPTGDGGETITSSIAGAFEDNSGTVAPESGQLLTLKSKTGVNDGTYTVISNDGTNIVVQSNLLNAESNSTTASISSQSYYKGDAMQLQQTIAPNQTVNVGTTAAYPAFEKAIRAMSIIAQGAYGTAGGLDQNMGRVSNSMFLLSDSLQSPAAGTPPYGPEAMGDINTISQDLGYTQQIITQANTTQSQISGDLQTQLASEINSDPTTTVTQLLNDSNTLQASYQALSQIKNLSLMNYLK